jgi:murein DD-endopeptidase MepM/ murein hydrolase activator NlpD
MTTALHLETSPDEVWRMILSRARLTPSLLVILGLLLASQAGAQTAIAVDPAPPRRGTLVRLTVAPTAPETVTELLGEIADEPLHFRSTDGVTWTSLAGIPIGGDDSLSFPVIVVRGDIRDTIQASIAVIKADYPSERLRVAPRMAEPDSAARRRIARETRRARAASRAAHTTERLWTEPFELPRDDRITSEYGTGREYNGRILSRHLGTDFAGTVGAPVRATNRGTVVLVDNFYLAGRVVYLNHGDGIVSAYFHLSKALVKLGETVERGELIGRVGQSGRVTGPHLHWVMRYGGTTVDPMSVMALLGVRSEK